MKQTKIKDTKLGQWLKDKAPKVLDTVGELLPDQGALGLVKNLLDQEPGISPEEAKARVDAEIAFQNNVTERWKADMGSDVTMVADSMDKWPFNVKDSYVSLLEILMLTAFGAYFAGRTIEKAKK